MRNLLFLMRVAFICNCCLLISWLYQYFPFLPEGAVSSTIIILGVGVSLLLNVGTNIWLISVVLTRKTILSAIPLWLIIANFLFLIPQIILLIK